VVVAINRFETDHDEEIDYVIRRARSRGAHDAVVSEVHPKGGAGGEAFARALIDAAQLPSRFQFLYPLDLSTARAR
jgi:formate--tetrahydrofolate ligase